VLKKGEKKEEQKTEETDKEKQSTSETKTTKVYQRDQSSEQITPDVWTVNDMLGYGAYSHAIFKFLTSDKTSPPLTISIQAPWGGGKTSLMRMIQNELDPDIIKTTKTPTTNPEQPSLDKLKNEIKSPGKEKLHLTPNPKKRITVWFNAWKYQNTEQVWAGLADAIIRQVVDQLKPEQRQKFWLRLHLKRTGVETIDSIIQKHVVSNWKEKVKKYIPVYLIAISASLIALIVDSLSPEGIPATGLGAVTITILGSGLGLFKQHLTSKTDVEKESAESILGQYVTVPNYSKNLGMLHHVEEDLRGVFEINPDRKKPIVIFIDDLDRCSPSKVANVMEAINLFLAADLPPCIFIMGMDTEMVAASLEEAHSKIIAKLPQYDNQTPLGWRFMDKFVQLPVILPRPDQSDLDTYVNALVAQQIDNQKISTAIKQVKFKKKEDKIPSEDVQSLIKKNKLSGAEISVFVKKLQELESLKLMDKKLKEIESTPILSNVIKETASFFSDNPRELKRYINLLRFQYFICTARESRNQPVPPLETLARWIILSLKWPDMIRWLQSGGESSDPHGKLDNTTKQRLLRLEQIARVNDNFSRWKSGIEDYLRVEKDSIRWANDYNLWQFFAKECDTEESKRISESTGKGIY